MELMRGEDGIDGGKMELRGGGEEMLNILIE